MAVRSSNVTVHTKTTRRADTKSARRGGSAGACRKQITPPAPPKGEPAWRLSRSVSIIHIALLISATLLVARPALVAILTVLPVYSIGTTRGGTHAAMPDKVANNSPDNRTLKATARIGLTCEGNGAKTKDGRNEKQLFHG
jgi:hypothetical protein